MKWLKRLEMEEFKIHRNKAVNFSRHMNVIVGDSESGKSTMNKAIIKCLLNEPDRKAEDFVNFSARNKRGAVAKIRCFVADDRDGQLSEADADVYVIERVLGKSVNEYNITYPNGETTTYAGFGKNVPPEVLSIHGMRKVDMGYGKEILNYASQFGGFFLLGKTNREVATALGRLAQTDIIDSISQGLRTDIDSQLRRGKALEREAASHQEKINSFNWIEAGLLAVEDSEAIADVIESMEKSRDRLQPMSVKIKASAAKIQESYRLLDDKTDYGKVAGLLEQAIQIDKGVSLLHGQDTSVAAKGKQIAMSYADTLKSVNTNAIESLILDAKSYLEAAQAINSASARVETLARSVAVAYGKIGFVPDIHEISKVLDVFSEIDAVRGSLQTKSLKIKEIASGIGSAVERERVAVEAERIAKERLRELSKDNCPTCGQSLAGVDIDDLATHLGV